ncbi:hypothetical protein V8E54_013016 [Elaphomyces granulatus]
MPSNFNVGMRPEGDPQCLMRFTSIKLNSTITLGSSEDVSFTVELDRAALSRIGVRNELSRENTEGRSKGCQDSTITTIEKTQGPRHHSDPLEAPRQAGGEKAPCVHNEPVIGIRLPARQPRHSSMHPGASSPAERGDFDASIHTLGTMASKLGVGPSKKLATRQAFLRRARIPSSVWDLPFVNLVTKDGGMELR